jgi:Flp pilus assembly pilin Flp
MLQRFLKDTQGATTIEYGLIVAGIACAIIAVVLNVGSALAFTKIQTAVK